jgi:hypothetical protein
VRRRLRRPSDGLDGAPAIANPRSRLSGCHQERPRQRCGTAGSGDRVRPGIGTPHRPTGFMPKATQVMLSVRGRTVCKVRLCPGNRHREHVYEKQRTFRCAAFPWGAPVIRSLRDLDDYEVAEIVRKKTEACVTAIVFGDEETQQGVAPSVVDADGKRIEQFEPGLIAYARGGKDIRFNQPRPLSAAMPNTSGPACTPSLRASGCLMNCLPGISPR